MTNELQSPVSGWTLARVATLGSLVMFAACASVRHNTPVSGDVAQVVTVGGLNKEQVLGRADSAWRAGSYPLATALFEAVLASDSSISVAVFRLATLHAWSNRLDDAERMFRRYVALEPRDTEGRLALARALAWGAKYPAALAIYDSVIAQDSTYRDAVVGRAQTLTWEGRVSEGLAFALAGGRGERRQRAVFGPEVEHPVDEHGR